jgi:phage/plasmid-like protein (TIGR03299 family)
LTGRDNRLEFDTSAAGRLLVQLRKDSKMAHMIDNTTGTNAIAYAGKTPWHGLGQALSADASIETWTREAGLAYDVLESPVLFRTAAASEPEAFKGRKVLHRSDTGAPLAVVSDGYHVVQPAEVMGFFDNLVKLGGFQLETAGALSYGRRVWALASVGAGADIVDGDTVKPYLLLGTSYDGTMATVAKFTTVRVVCNNTITAALGDNTAAVRVLHSERFDADAVRLELGIVANNWERFLIESRRLAGVTMGADEAERHLCKTWRGAWSGARDSRPVLPVALAVALGSRFAHREPRYFSHNGGGGGGRARRGKNLYCWRWFDRNNSLDGGAGAGTIEALTTERIVIWDSICI